MRHSIVLMMILISAGLAFANDTSFSGQGGTLRPLRGEHKSVRMVREWVRMDVYPDYYDVTAQFVFENSGPAASVEMGFPENGYSTGAPIEVRNRSAFTRFRTWVDGEEVPARRLSIRRNPIEGPYGTYWVKTVPFRPGQRRTVRVQYRSKPGRKAGSGRFASYHFTGGNWKGQVAESSLVAFTHIPGKWKTASSRNLQGQMRRFAGHWVNWQAQSEARVYYDAGLQPSPDW